MSPQKVKANLSFRPSAGNQKSRKMKVRGQVSVGCGKTVADPKPNTTENEATNSQLCNCSDRACVCTVPILRALPNEQRPRGDVTVFVSAMDVLARCDQSACRRTATDTIGHCRTLQNTTAGHCRTTGHYKTLQEDTT